MAKDKVLIYISNLAIGGAQNMVFELARKIKKYDVEILCHSAKQGNSLEEKIEKEFHVTYLNNSGHAGPDMLINVLRTITRINPVVIHTHMGVTVYGILWCKIHRKKCVVTVHTKPNVAFSRLNEKAVRYGLKKDFVRIVAVSEENQNLCKKYFHSDKIEYVNNGIDISRYYKKQHDCYTFIHVARQDKNKNAEFIIDCFKAIIDQGYKAKLLLLGDGPEHNNLIMKVQDLSLTKYVAITGNVSNTWDFYAVSDCFLLASHREALPMTSIEALATGLPIIATNVGGLKDIVNTNGRLVDDGDREAYVASMLDALNGVFNGVEHKCHKYAEMFSSEKMAEEYEEIYGE